MRGRGQGAAGAERETESEAGSRLWAVGTELDMELKPMNREIVTWAEVGQLTAWATQAPPDFIVFLSDIYTQRGARTHNSEIKSHMLHRLSQPGTPFKTFLYASQ